MFAVVLRFRVVRPFELDAICGAGLADDGSSEADETGATERVPSLEANEAREDICTFAGRTELRRDF